MLLPSQASWSGVWPYTLVLDVLIWDKFIAVFFHFAIMDSIGLYRCVQEEGGSVMELQREQSSFPQNFFRFIPEEVLNQLYFHLDTLPAHISRMVDLLVESDMRVKELCTLPFDCLLQFRHAVIAQMINGGVPLHIIQYYLNAQTLDEVVGVYKQLFGPSRKEEFIPLLAEVADRKWKCDQRRELFNWEEVPWISKNRLTKNTPVGYFPLPPTVNPCPHTCHCRAGARFFQG